MKIVIGTNNHGKTQEIKEVLGFFSIKGVTLNELGIKEKPQETGKTFEENALIKAQFYSRKTGLPTISDDGGLEIPALNGAPGVKSRRWPGKEASDEELINYTLSKMKKISGKYRKAFLRTVVCLYFPDGQYFFQEGKIQGIIKSKPSPKRVNGYPYRSLFYLTQVKKYYDELTEIEHKRLNHRIKAIKRLLKKVIHKIDFPNTRSLS